MSSSAISSERPFALVTGATGTIGPIFIEELLTHGYQVRALVREKADISILPQGTKIVYGDIFNRQALREATAAVDVIFHLAAKLHINNPSPELRASYHKVNVEGTQRLAEAAEVAKVKRFIFFSTINVYGPCSRGEVHDENSPLLPDSWYSESKIAAEEFILDAYPSVVLRLAAVYGPRMKGNYPRLVDALTKKRFIYIGNGSNRRTLVHARDIPLAAILAANHPCAIGRIYNITDGQIHTLREIITAICRAQGQVPPTLQIPLKPTRWAAGFVEDIIRLLGRTSPIGRWTIDKVIEDMAVQGSKIQQELGFCPRYDLLSGWQQALGISRQH